MRVWLNGQFIDRDEARVSVFDAAVQHAVGLIETMLARNGRVFRAERHMQRLASSARDLRLTDSLRARPLVEAVNLAVRENELDAARVRLTITGGDLNLLQSERKSPADPTILIVAQPPTDYPDAMFEKGVLVTLADPRANPFDPFAGHKTLNYWPRIAALQVAAGRQAGESLWFGVSNHLASGCVSNAFLVKDGVLYTPIARGEEEPGALPSPVLPGITRATIIELADAMGLGTSKRLLDINAVLDADEVFLTNSSWGVLPVVAVEQHAIADGRVGEVTKRLRERWLDVVEDETSQEAP